MSIPALTENYPPPSSTVARRAISLALLLTALFIIIPARVAFAAEDNPEPGVVFVQHQLIDDSGNPHSTSHQAFTTYTADKEGYTARINASAGAVNIENRWTASADNSDITHECSYDKRSGLVSIPRAYLDKTVTISVNLDAEQSAQSFTLNASVVFGSEPNQTNPYALETTANQTSIAIPIPSAVKAVTQDSRVLDPSEYRTDSGTLSIEGRSALLGSITVYLEGFAPEVLQRNAIRDYNDTLIQRSIQRATPANMLARSNMGGWFDGWGWIWSTNQGPGDWDYTDYVMQWQGKTFVLYCCEHGVYHMPQSEGGGGSVYFTASLVSTSLVNQYDTADATTIYHHKVYRNTYYAYVDAGWYQDVDGYYSEDYETVTTSPRLGGIELSKASANPSLTSNNPSYSVEGAVYGVFSDAACTNQINTLETNASGKASLWGFYAGSSVYIKETGASKGYDLDPNVYRANIVADQYSSINGGTVYEPPKTLTVRYFVDGGTEPLYTDSSLPLGSTYDVNKPGFLRATELARKPNCTPGLNAWFTDKALTEKYKGSTLTTDLDLYARNVATLTYALSPSSVLTPELSVRAAMSDSSFPLSIQHDILPPSRLVNWGSTVSFAEPRYSALYHFDGERWRTLRRNSTGWFDTPSLVGTSKTSKRIECDTTVYTDYVISTYDGIVMW